MTFDQFTHLLAVLAWPTVALIAGVAAVHCCRLLTEVLADESERWRKSSFELALLVEERRSRTAVRVARVNTWPDVVGQDETEMTAIVRAGIGRKMKVGRTAETALMTLLAANGGFPGGPKDDSVRQIVREVRKLYEEVEHPTPESPAAKDALRAPMADADDLTLDELFGPAMSMEDDDGEEGL